MSNMINLDEGARRWLKDQNVRKDLGNSLAGWMDPDAFIGQILIALQDPKLACCTQKSHFEAAHKCAALQLLPSLDQVALIPRKNKVVIDKKEKWVEVIVVMPQWQGYKSLMERHPDVLDVDGKLVHVLDDYGFDHDGRFIHSYDPFHPERIIRKAKDIKGGYVKITYRDGRPPKWHFTPVHEIEKRRDCAETQNVWSKWYSQQALKSCYRDAYARRVVPVDTVVASRLQELARADDLALGNDPQRVATIIDARGGESRPRLSRTEQLAQNMGASSAPPPEEAEEESRNDSPKETAKKKSTKKKTEPRPAESKRPELPALLEDYAQALDAAETASDVKKAYSDHIDGNRALEPDDWDAAVEARDWKLRQLSPPKQGQLVHED